MELFVQSLDFFFNCGSPFELVNRKVEWIHGATNYHLKPVKIKCWTDATCLIVGAPSYEHGWSSRTIKCLPLLHGER